MTQPFLQEGWQSPRGEPDPALEQSPADLPEGGLDSHDPEDGGSLSSRRKQPEEQRRWRQWVLDRPEQEQRWPWAWSPAALSCRGAPRPFSGGPGGGVLHELGRPLGIEAAILQKAGCELGKPQLMFQQNT